MLFEGRFAAAFHVVKELAPNARQICVGSFGIDSAPQLVKVAAGRSAGARVAQHICCSFFRAVRGGFVGLCH